MKSLCLITALCFIAFSSYATEIEVTSNDCNYEVRRERDGVIIKVNKIVAVKNSVSHYDIELPSPSVEIPLVKNLNKKLIHPNGDETIIKYKNGTLTHDHKAKSNYTRDTLVLNISSDLKSIRWAKFTRKGTGILSLFEKEKFECNF